MKERVNFECEECTFCIRALQVGIEAEAKRGSVSVKEAKYEECGSRKYQTRKPMSYP